MRSREYLFGEGGGDRLATDYGVGMLGALAPAVVDSATDRWWHTGPEGKISDIFREIARQVGASLWRNSLDTSSCAPVIETLDD